jgi:acyl dehydratase
MYLEDFEPGHSVELGPIEVDLDEVVAFARRYDPQYFHVDAEAAVDGPYGGLIASGWHTCAMVMRVLVDGYLSASSSLGSPGVDELRWLAPVRPGDELRVRVTVASARASRSKPDRGIVRTDIVARNQDETVVMSMTATNLVRSRPVVQQTIVGALTSDHRAIEQMLADAAITEPTEPGQAAREQLVMELVRHFVAEEQYLYPTVREHLSNGTQIADSAFGADRACEQALKLLEDSDITPLQTAAALADVQQRFAGHVQVQEETIFPALVRECDPAVLVELTDGVLGAEQLAPTRPRHVAFAAPGLNKVSSFVAGYIDHVRDYYSKRGVSEHPEPEPPVTP